MGDMPKGAPSTGLRAKLTFPTGPFTLKGDPLETAVD